ncbi:MAG TPA: PIN domain-containing protein [Thermoleophilaceae bacterium]|nr:PIN domain-containing protein [Thermoleophilaceae bacterium]
MLFVDSSFWIALRFHRDSRHEDAKRLFARYGDDPLVTTNLVKGETWTFIRDRMGHGPAVDLVERIGSSDRLEVARVSELVEEDALDWLRKHDERVYSFVDATSFAFMRDRRITEALAFDADFSAAGFVELRS